MAANGDVLGWLLQKMAGTPQGILTQLSVSGFGYVWGLNAFQSPVVQAINSLLGSDAVQCHTLTSGGAMPWLFIIAEGNCLKSSQEYITLHHEYGLVSLM